MIDTKLLILEGLPATGKTTISQFLQMQLERNGRSVHWFHEVADPHPTIFIPDGLSLDEQYKRLATEKWASFAERALSNPNDIYIFDSAVFQFPIFWFLLNNAPNTDLQDFVRGICNIAAPLKPCLLYLYREDTEASIDYLEKDRGTQDLANFWERDRAMPYYQDKPAGAEGFKQFLQDYARTAEGLFDAAPCQKAAFQIFGDDWTCCKNEMLSFLEIERRPSPVSLPPGGVYRNDALNFEITVDGLSMIDPTGCTRALIPKSCNEFYVERLPAVLRFDHTKQITIAGSQIVEPWTTTGTVYKK